jgi:integrase
MRPYELLGVLWKNVDLERGVRRAGIDGLRLHDLRHEATSRFFERGLNVMEVASVTGHKTLQMLIATRFECLGSGAEARLEVPG